MSKMKFTPKTGLIIFISLTIVVFVQSVWWIYFMAKLIGEKFDIAEQLGADANFINKIKDKEVSQQIMIGLEGVFFLILIIAGAWLIYRALRKAEELKFHQQNFLMAVTHELKTPMAAIKIYLGTLASTKVPEEKKAEILPRIKDDLNRLEKLVENILDAGRFDRSGYHIEKQNFNLSRLIEQSLTDIKSHPSKTLIKINQNIAPDLNFIGDRKALERAIDAILENCLKYNDKDEIHIDVKFTEDDKHYTLSISDNGIGLEKKDFSEVFNRFYRVGDEMRRSKPGSGLGLYLSREIIQAHEGKISATSAGVGKGSTFTIKLKKNNNGGN